MIDSTYLKKALLAALVFFAVSTLNEAQAQYRSGSTELGVVLGEPTGVSIQVWQSGTRAIDGALAWSFGRDDKIHVHADYLKHDQLSVDRGSLTFFYGIGARAILADDARFGPRFPIGLHYVIPDSRFSLFFEVAPIFDLVPATDFDVNGGIGVRYFL
ncbi:MAG: hypothetical protein U5K72_14910 [Balneolaceae bacterium]|nr:hypothetical protein [Balneolaceae bacterium]